MARSETAEPVQRAPVLIIGAHRSGTSATARALQMIGLQIGQQLDSHFESKRLQKLHDEYLHRVSASWHDPAPFLESLKTPQGRRECVEFLRQNMERDFGAILGYRKNPRGLWLLARIKHGVPWGWKEPRTTLFGPAWLEIFPEARVIHVIRHPIAVARSIQQRELRFRGDGDRAKSRLDDLDYCLRLALEYVRAGDRLANSTPNYRLVRFEDVQANPRETLKALAEFAGVKVVRTQLLKAAVSIKVPKGSVWRELPEQTARELYLRYPDIAKLGYVFDHA